MVVYIVPGRRGPVHTSVPLQHAWFKLNNGFVTAIPQKHQSLGTGILSPPRCAPLMTDQPQQ